MSGTWTPGQDLRSLALNQGFGSYYKLIRLDGVNGAKLSPYVAGTGNGTDATYPGVQASALRLVGSNAYTGGNPASSDRIWVSLNGSHFDPDTAVPLMPLDSVAPTGGFKGFFLRLAGFQSPTTPPVNNTTPIDLVVEVSAGYNITPGGLSSPQNVTPGGTTSLSTNLAQVGGTNYALGLHTSPSSIPVVLASDVVPTVSIGALNGTAIGQKASAASLPVVLASDQSTLSIALPPQFPAYTTSGTITTLGGAVGTNGTSNGGNAIGFSISGSWTGTLEAQAAVQNFSSLVNIPMYFISSSLTGGMQVSLSSPGTTTSNISNGVLFLPPGASACQIISINSFSGSATITFYPMPLEQPYPWNLVSSPTLPGYIQQVCSNGLGGTNAYSNGAVSNTPLQIKTSAGQIQGVNLYSPSTNTAITFVEFYDTTSSPTLSTTPKFYVPVPFGTGGGFVNLSNGDVGVQFSNGIWIVAVTALQGSTAPTTAIHANLIEYV